MKGTVFKYGAQGDPLLRPENGGRIVILTGYPERPKIGSTVEYDVTRHSNSVDYGVLRQAQSRKPASTTQVSENPLERSLNEIQILWDTSFSRHMTAEAQRDFPRSLQEIRERHSRGDYQGAAQIAHENYEWALDGSETFEVSKVGAAYFPMFSEFKVLEELLKKAT